jgi:hypothetical protein
MTTRVAIQEPVCDIYVEGRMALRGGYNKMAALLYKPAAI